MEFFKEFILNNQGAAVLGIIIFAWKIGPIFISKISRDIKKVKAESDKADEKLEQSIDIRFDDIKSEFKEFVSETKEGLKKEREISRDMVKDVWPELKEAVKSIYKNEVRLAKQEARMYKEFYEREKDERFNKKV